MDPEDRPRNFLPKKYSDVLLLLSVVVVVVVVVVVFLWGWYLSFSIPLPTLGPSSNAAQRTFQFQR